MLSVPRVAAIMLLMPPMSSVMESHSGQSFIRSTAFGYVDVDAESAESATEERNAAYRSAGSVLNLADARFGIVDSDYTTSRWGDRSPDGLPVYVWTFRKSSTNRTLPPPVYLLRHEIGHDLFVRYLVPSTKRDQYGGDAPDWLDEMAAVAFEGEALKAIRRRAAVRYAREAKLIPLQRFLTMVHPEMAKGSIPTSSGQLAPVFEARSNETLQFYSTATAFYDFLVIRTKSAAIIAQLAAAFRDGENLDQWILARTGYEERENGIEALNADFLTWIACDPDYGGGASR